MNIIIIRQPLECRILAIYGFINNQIYCLTNARNDLTFTAFFFNFLKKINMNCSQKLCYPTKRNQIVEKSLDLQMEAKMAKKSLIWGSINILLLAILLFDISNKCPFAVSKWYYIEYAAAGILAASVLCNFFKYLFYVLGKESVEGTKEQKNLLGFEDNDTSFVTASKAKQNQIPIQLRWTLQFSVGIHPSMILPGLQIGAIVAQFHPAQVLVQDRMFHGMLPCKIIPH